VLRLQVEGFNDAQVIGFLPSQHQDGFAAVVNPGGVIQGAAAGRDGFFLKVMCQGITIQSFYPFVPLDSRKGTLPMVLSRRSKEPQGQSSLWHFRHPLKFGWLVFLGALMGEPGAWHVRQD